MKRLPTRGGNWPVMITAYSSVIHVVNKLLHDWNIFHLKDNKNATRFCC